MMERLEAMVAVSSNPRLDSMPLREIATTGTCG